MKATAELSADLKQRLRTLPVTTELINEANAFPAERDEALSETESGLIPASLDSYVYRVLNKG